jgi:hypothetical protein
VEPVNNKIFSLSKTITVILQFRIFQVRLNEAMMTLKIYLCNIEELDCELVVFSAVPHHVGPVGVTLDTAGLYHSRQHYHNPAHNQLELVRD